MEGRWEWMLEVQRDRRGGGRKMGGDAGSPEGWGGDGRTGGGETHHNYEDSMNQEDV